MAAAKKAAEGAPVEPIDRAAAVSSTPTTTEPAPVEPIDRLVEALKRQRESVVPVVEDGRSWNPAKIPYYVDDVRVTREEYVAHQREQRKQELKDEITAIVAEDVASVPSTPPADQATSKE